MDGIPIDIEAVRLIGFYSTGWGLGYDYGEISEVVRGDYGFAIAQRGRPDRTVPRERVLAFVKALSDSSNFQSGHGKLQRDMHLTSCCGSSEFRIKVVTSEDIIVADLADQHSFPGPSWHFRRRLGTPFRARNAELRKASADILPDDFKAHGRLVPFEPNVYESAQEEIEQREGDSTFGQPVPINERDEPLFHLGWEKQPIAALHDLLSNGADINAQDHLGRTALLAACEYKKFFLVEPLLKAGADVQVPDSYGRNALSTACDHIPNPEALSVIKRLIDVGSDTRLSLQTVISGHSRFVKVREWILATRPDLEARDANGFTGLMHAVVRSNSGTKCLLRHGADVNAVTPNGTSALMLARLSPETMRILLDAGANINATDDAGLTTLMLAVKERFIGRKVIPFLLDSGADLTIRDRNNRTALDIAEDIEAIEVMAHEARVEMATSGLDEDEAQRRVNVAERKDLHRARIIRQVLESA